MLRPPGLMSVVKHMSKSVSSFFVDLHLTSSLAIALTGTDTRRIAERYLRLTRSMDEHLMQCNTGLDNPFPRSRSDLVDCFHIVSIFVQE
jgi:hypothetical protein